MVCLVLDLTWKAINNGTSITLTKPLTPTRITAPAKAADLSHSTQLINHSCGPIGIFESAGNRGEILGLPFRCLGFWPFHPDASGLTAARFTQELCANPLCRLHSFDFSFSLNG
jgi:hypothetical protein